MTWTVRALALDPLPPAFTDPEPITLLEAKNYCRVDNDNNVDDDLLNLMIVSCRMLCEEFTGLSFGKKTIEYFYDSYDMKIKLPYGPVNSIEIQPRWNRIQWENISRIQVYFEFIDMLSRRWMLRRD